MATTFAKPIIAGMTAHSELKRRLNETIARKSIDDAVAAACADDACSFGRWLRTEADAALRSTDEFRRVEAAHQCVHQAASAIVGEVRTGRIDAAVSALNSGGAYEREAAEFQRAMTALLASAGRLSA
jgi:hypothetical protein